jgi:hypothetical protein
MSKKDQVELELEQVAARDAEGLLRPAAVIEFASDPKTALHSKFEWDDTEAAHQYRLEQARSLIRCYIKIVEGEKPEKMRAFVSLTTDRREGGGYRALATVLSNDEMRRRLLADAYVLMRSFMVKYGNLRELSDVIEAMNRVVGKEKATG